MEDLDPEFLAWIHRTYWSGQEVTGGPVHLVRPYNPEAMEGINRFFTIGTEDLELTILVGAARVITEPYCDRCLHFAQLSFSRHRNDWRPNPEYL